MYSYRQNDTFLYTNYINIHTIQLATYLYYDNTYPSTQHKQHTKQLHYSLYNKHINHYSKLKYKDLRSIRTEAFACMVFRLAQIISLRPDCS